MSKSTNNTKVRGIPVVLGGGARRGGYLTGFLEWLLLAGVTVSYYMGVSIGAVVAAFITNGYTPRQISKILRKELFRNNIFCWMTPTYWLESIANGRSDWKMWIRILIPPLNPVRWFGMPLMDMLPVMQELVKKYDLKPNRRLKIVAFDILRLKPVVFEGVRYDLATALAASVSVFGPGLMRPVTCWHSGSFRVLIDGGFYHPHPGVLTKSRAIVAKLIDNSLMSSLFADREGDYIVSLSDDFEPFFSSLTDKDVDYMHVRGKKRTHDALRVPFLSGAIPAHKTRKPDAESKQTPTKK